MRILMITTSYLPKLNGVTRTVSDLSVGLCRRNNHVVVLTRWRGERPKQEPGCPSVQRVGIGRRIGEGFAFSILLTAKAVSIVRGEGIDVMHAHGTVAGMSAALVKMITGTRFVVTFHQDALLGGQTGFNRIPGIKSSLTRFVQMMVCSQAEVITVQSDTVGEMVTRELGIKNLSKVVTLPNPIDTSKAIGKREARSPGRILYVGNLIPRKRVDLLIRAFALVRNQIPTAKLVIVGKGPQSGSLGLLASEMRVDDDVIFTGQLSDVDLAREYSRAAVFALASEAEVFGVVVGEALSFETPVVSTKTVGAQSIIIPGFSGILTEINDPLGLARGILAVITDDKKARLMAANGKASVLRNYRLDLVTGKLEQIYGRLAHTRK